MTDSTLINGKALADKILNEIKENLEKKHTGRPGLATVLVGEDPASQIYVANKRKAAAAIGFKSAHHQLASSCSQEELLQLILALNNDKDIDGILVQLPLPKHIDENRIIEALDPKKDVDGFHPLNLGYLLMGRPKTVACTPLGVVHMLKSTGQSLAGKHAVIVGRSTIVGKPLFHLLLQENCTVTVCHSQTKDLTKVCQSGDILIAALGKPRFINADYIKSGAMAIDVGISRDAQGKICGDLDFSSVSQKAAYISPVPGGVGPLTIAMLMKNTFANFCQRHIHV